MSATPTHARQLKVMKDDLAWKHCMSLFWLRLKLLLADQHFLKDVSFYTYDLIDI